MSAPQQPPVFSAQLRESLDGLWERLDRESGSAATTLMRSAEIAISAPEGAVRVGRDADGRRHLLVPISLGQRLDDDLRSAGVHLTTRVLLVDDLPIRFADLVCRREHLNGVFSGLAADMCARVAVQPADVPFRIAQTLNSWRLLLGGQAERWTVPRLAGVFAELLVLERMLEIEPASVRAWQGPIGAAQDFRSTRHAIEVKATVSTSGRVVGIHGAEQLERPPNGCLDLAWFRLAVSSASEARSVLDVVEACRRLADRVDLLESRAAAIGLNDCDDPVVAGTRFEPVDERWYDVDESFPRIVPESFRHGAVPLGVLDLEYLVDLDNIPSGSNRNTALDRLAKDL
ncbi:PD-(D/E)XK motif protein [Kitasatospora herbaricolor]|uniref:PD-(D/E)XK motif protein n=1 Tax=Kitasatospora herbaricolor TaxID=68217 RepID=UPI0036DED8EA